MALFGIIDCNLTKNDKKDKFILTKLFIHEMSRATLDRNLVDGQRERNFSKLKNDAMVAWGDESAPKR
jgi:hypothetical protein